MVHTGWFLLRGTKDAQELEKSNGFDVSTISTVDKRH